jgi:hypothetical protein
MIRYIYKEFIKSLGDDSMGNEKLNNVIQIAKSKGFDVSTHNASSGMAWRSSKITIFMKDGEQDYTLRLECGYDGQGGIIPLYFYKNIDEYCEMALTYLNAL